MDFFMKWKKDKGDASLQDARHRRMNAKVAGPQHEYHIGGVKVKFPCKAYPTQITMMAKVLNDRYMFSDCPVHTATSLSLADHPGTDSQRQRPLGEPHW